MATSNLPSLLAFTGLRHAFTRFNQVWTLINRTSMMTISDAVSLTISIVSLLAAAYIAVRQYVLAKNSNNLPTTFELLKQFREPGLHESFDFVINELSARDSSKGLMNLADAERVKVFDVCYFIQQIAMMIILGLADEIKFSVLIRARTIAVWNSVKPFVESERLLNSAVGPDFFTLLEAFAIKVSRLPPDTGKIILDNWLDEPVRGPRRRVNMRIWVANAFKNSDATSAQAK
jgi:hypothetical protein